MKTYVHLFFLESEVFNTNLQKKITTHLMFNNFYTNRAVYEIMCKSMVEPQMTIIWGMLDS